MLDLLLKNDILSLISPVTVKSPFIVTELDPALTFTASPIAKVPVPDVPPVGIDHPESLLPLKAAAVIDNESPSVVVKENVIGSAKAVPVSGIPRAVAAVSLLTSPSNENEIVSNAAPTVRSTADDKNVPESDKVYVCHSYSSCTSIGIVYHRYTSW